MKDNTMSERKYLIDGSEVEVRNQIHDCTWLVRNVYNEDDGDEYLGEARIVYQVFDEPPVKKFADKVKDLQAEIELLLKENNQLIYTNADLRQEMIKLNQEHESRMKVLKSYSGLENLENLLTGKVTHFLTFGEYRYGEELIVDYTDADTISNVRGHSQPILCLYLNLRNNTPEWKISAQQNTSRCIPCASYNEAIEKLQKRYLDMPVSEMNGSVIQVAKTYGVILPAGHVEAYKQAVMKSKIADVEQYKERLKEAEAELNKLQEE